MSTVRTLPLLSALPLFVFATNANAQSQAEIQAELEFARGLASEWAFVDLAEEVLADLERRGVSGPQAERLGLTRCELSSVGARNERDPETRRSLFEACLSCYEDYIDGNPFSNNKSAAESSLVSTSALYARYLELDMEDAAGEDLAALKSRQVVVLNKAVALTGDLISNLESAGEERSELQTRDMFQLMLDRGNMLATIGRADPSNSFFFDEAVKSLEELVFAAGEATPFALRAYAAIGNTYAYQQQWEEAAAYYEAVIEQTIPTNEEEWDLMKKDMGLTAADVNVRFLFLEITIEGLMEAYASLGDYDSALKYGMHFLNIMRSEGVNVSASGYLSTLAVASTLLDSNGYVAGDAAVGEAQWYASEEEAKEAVKNKRLRSDTTSFAMGLANQVNDENKGTALQVKAQKLIAEISTRPGVTVSLDLQYQAAEGEFYGENFDESLRLLRKLLVGLEGVDEVERLELGGRVYNLMANAYRRSERPLEAAMAFRYAAREFNGDPELFEKSAKGYNALIKQVSRGANGEDAALKALIIEAEDLMTQIPELSPGSIYWGRGMKAYDDRDYAGAITHFKLIEENDDFWEKAYVQIAISKFRDKKYAEAVVDLDRFIEEIVKDPSRSTESPIKLGYRKQALSSAEFFRGLGTYIAKDYAKVIELLGDYHVRFEDQTKLCNWTLDMLMRSYLELNQRAEAAAALGTMVERFGDTKRTGEALIAYYNTMRVLLEAEKDPTKRVAIEREMAEHLERTNGIGNPDFPALRNESKHWITLEEWVKAEKALERIVELHGSDKSREKDINQYVYPDLGHVYLELKKVIPAKTVLSPLIELESPSASRRTVMDWSRAVSGWLTGGPSDIQHVPGASGSDEEYDLIIGKLTSLSKSRTLEAWSDCEWYEVKFMIAFTYFAWSQENSSKTASLERQLNNISIQINSDDFTAIDSNCDSDDTSPPDVKSRLGGGVLRSWFQWLKRQY